MLLTPLLLIGCAPMSNEELLKPYQIQRDHPITSTKKESAGFNANEAKSLLELCIELNNQDDRNNSELPDPSKNYFAKADDWSLVYDSRHPGNTEWNKNWNYTTEDKEAEKPNPNDVKTNGLKPLNNAWILAQSKNETGHYAIAIRGTVSEWQSILADAYATTIPAYAGIEYPNGTPLPITFAATPKAEVHLGFAYAAFSLLFDPERGILVQLKDKPNISKLSITGHSQGAAVATLIHAFLHYAISDNTIKYPLDSLKNAFIKSYLFAQPKPGNLQFSQDYSRITKDYSFVINNDRDPVPQVPLSLETVSEVATFVEEDNPSIEVGGMIDHIIEKVTETKNSVRNKVSEFVIGKLADKFEKTQINQSVEKYFSDLPQALADEGAKSLNYTLVGQLIPVFGAKNGEKDGVNLYRIDNRKDILLQHHATSYRYLIEQQLK